jgi:hypothetical protein
MCGSGRLGSSHHVWRDDVPYAWRMVGEFRGKFSETLTERTPFARMVIHTTATSWLIARPIRSIEDHK